MEIDLAVADPPVETVRSEVCVIGAGIAGLALARKLRQRGVDVVLLEAGGYAIEGSGQRLLAEAKQVGQRHVGTGEGRFRVFGGSSLRWGGQLLGMTEDAARDWPIAWEELTKFSKEAERALAVDKLPFEAEEFFAAVHAPVPPMLAQLSSVDARLSKWMTFSQRNLAGTVGKELVGDPHVRVYLHAQVTELLLAPSGTHIEAVWVRTPAGAAIRFEAKHFVVAAGTVETSRLLLASRSVAQEGVGNAHDQVGRRFQDHLTLPVATITGSARVRVLRDLRPWVLGGTLHSLKLETSRALRDRLQLNPILAHFAIDEPEGSGVAVVRELLTAMQRGDLLRAFRENAARIPEAGWEAVRLGWEAKLQHRRYVSADAAVKLQFNAAQELSTSSRIALDSQRGAERDAFGMPQVMVDWRVTKHEIATLRGFAEHLRGEFEAMGLAGVEWEPALFRDDAPFTELDDARHAMGGACMGSDPRSSVVDTDLTVHGVKNLSIASAAVFPDGGPQLPTLTMVALSLRLGERVAERVKAQIHG